jgi:hypothetical protein
MPNQEENAGVIKIQCQACFAPLDITQQVKDEHREILTSMKDDGLYVIACEYCGVEHKVPMFERVDIATVANKAYIDSILAGALPINFSGALAIGDGATAVGARGVNVKGGTGNISTGDNTMTVITGTVITDGDFVGRDKTTVHYTNNSVEETHIGDNITLTGRGLTDKIEVLRRALRK